MLLVLITPSSGLRTTRAIPSPSSVDGASPLSTLALARPFPAVWPFYEASPRSRARRSSDRLETTPAVPKRRPTSPSGLSALIGRVPNTLSLRYAAPGPTASTYWGRIHPGDAHAGLSPTRCHSSPVARRAEHYAIQTPERTNHRKFPSPLFSQTRRDRRVEWPAVRTVRTPSATSATRREKEVKVKRKEREGGTAARRCLPQPRPRFTILSPSRSQLPGPPIL